ncbi:hypothetical protein EDD22DRAFT_872719 [Suillus occidentalis]|nr:hypothetical protein EDD22DRAFT_872719 [Suillus occidentalis]
MFPRIRSPSFLTLIRLPMMCTHFILILWSSPRPRVQHMSCLNSPEHANNTCHTPQRRPCVHEEIDLPCQNRRLAPS